MRRVLFASFVLGVFAPVAPPRPVKLRVMFDVQGSNVSRQAAIAAFDSGFFADTLLARSEVRGPAIPDSAQRAAGFAFVLARGSIKPYAQNELEVCVTLFNLLMVPLAGPDTVHVRRERLDSALASLGRRYGASLADRRSLMSSRTGRCG